MRRAAAAVLALVAAMLVWVPAGVAGAAPEAKRPHPKRKPWPVTVTVRTVPALPGVGFTFDGRSLVTDAAGTTSYTAEHNFTKHTIALRDTTFERGDRRYRFVRWAGQRDPEQAYLPTVTDLPMRANYTVTVAFAVQYKVTGAFVDTEGKAVTVAEGTVAKVRSDTGATADLPAGGAVWLDGSVPVYHQSTLKSSDVSYAVQSVTIAGGNVVDVGRQRFQPATSGTVTVALRFHDLTVRAHDALLRTRVRQTAEVTFPDGSSRTVRLGPDGTVRLDNLPRGTYRVNVDAAGVLVDRRFVLSRDRDVDVAVISVADLVLTGLAGLFLAVGMLLYGRAGWRGRCARFLRRVVRR
ncbi:hypothetical protein [Dactylosporangium sp. NPDC005555]|uniref:hypothetical protein n=1 Tax=Dactylosporangium sp. NPDC005555 TaxID=3154889 RepID=UPI0033B84C02